MLLLSAQEKTQSWWKSEAIRSFWSSFCISLLIPGKKHEAKSGAGVQEEKGCDCKDFLSAEVGAGDADRPCIPWAVPLCAAGAQLSGSSTGRTRQTLTCNNQVYENQWVCRTSLVWLNFLLKRIWQAWKMELHTRASVCFLCYLQQLPQSQRALGRGKFLPCAGLSGLAPQNVPEAGTASGFGGSRAQWAFLWLSEMRCVWAEQSFFTRLM